MSTVNWPAWVKYQTADYGIEFDVQISTMRSGKVYTYGLPGARWTATISFPNDSENGLRPALEALLVSLEGGANRLALGHLGRPIPRGTLRATPTLSGSHAAGVKSLNITGASTSTLLAGDLIGVPNQLLMVMADVTAVAGAMTVSTRPALFAAHTNGEAVTWNQPTTLWIPRSTIAGPFPFRAGKYRPGFSIDLVESGV